LESAESAFALQVLRANEKLAAAGERVLAFAYKRLPSDLYPLGCTFDLR